MINEIICVVCERSLHTAQELEDEICNACMGNADSLNNNKSKAEMEANGGDDPVAVDLVINRGKPVGFVDFFVPEDNDND